MVVVLQRTKDSIQLEISSRKEIPKKLIPISNRFVHESQFAVEEQGIYTTVSVMCRNILTRVSKKDTVGYLKTSMAHRKDVVASIRRLESTCRALETPGISSRTLSKGHHFGRISRNNRPSVLSLPSWRERLTFVALVIILDSFGWFGHWFSNVCPLDYQPFADLLRFLEKRERDESSHSTVFQTGRRIPFSFF